MILDIEHRIDFNYSGFISESWMELRIEPKSTPEQTVRNFFLAVGPPTKVTSHRDWMDNYVHHFGIPKYHDRIEVLARSIVETDRKPVPLDTISGRIEDSTQLGPVHDFLVLGGPIVDFAALREMHSQLSLRDGAGVGETVAAIDSLLAKEIKYKPHVTQYLSTISDALEKRAGVCQDIAQIMIGLLRLSGIPARYVNGYLHVVRKGEEFAESHAWVEFMCPDGKWAGYDPTNKCTPDNNYVVVAQGRHYDDAPPNKGVYRGQAEETLTATVKTTITDRPEVNDFRDTIGSLDVPVYAKIPLRRSGTTSSEDETVGQEQQQQ